MLFRLIVPLILVIGQCTIAMQFWRVGRAPEHPPAITNPPVEVAQTSLAPISHEEIAISSLERVDNAKEADSLGLSRKQGEHRITITSDTESTTSSTLHQIQPSQDNAISKFESTPEMDHPTRVPNQQSRYMSQHRPMQRDITIKCPPCLAYATSPFAFCGGIVLVVLAALIYLAVQTFKG
ncbi:hypothetical protein MJO28_009571 [Puccinia striiformis f. sp. tritici]|uniref:Uncharacterized protein n=2 Tax=Puccinia striiformis f. sp. tritici TaxID=168172 RepID=A0A0L0UVG0_9BASI|nr:hypothetical protein Pst134EA_017567 [Puccinia striiformis f. sp. tritici]KAH9461260.1 hypothetical protein Pst134EA_017567 [Puccinia striiformis f. sp. tritici]KAI7947663.1 hypothetical protein MJO28_009571 [Puccinia striiformis f. sp. tritici]KAI9615028.1 hypothetical protein KEM48_005767 [Puccinia striiformis f. sp. tritici PST-130]KNE90931.1 hypothetical protein PSTG_15626 [Puccinia striiformis f. sp. tritici PST-78]